MKIILLINDKKLNFSKEKNKIIKKILENKKYINIFTVNNKKMTEI